MKKRWYGGNIKQAPTVLPHLASFWLRAFYEHLLHKDKNHEQIEINPFQDNAQIYFSSIVAIAQQKIHYIFSLSKSALQLHHLKVCKSH